MDTKLIIGIIILIICCILAFLIPLNESEKIDCNERVCEPPKEY